MVSIYKSIKFDNPLFFDILQSSKNKFYQFIVKTEECWIWRGYVDRNGYGRFRFCNNKNRIDIKAHRASYFFHYGKLSSELLVCHHCDNPICVNPFHLFMGSSLDNMTDKIIKNRSVNVKGEQHGRHKLTTKDVYDILLMIKNKLRDDEISKIKNIGRKTVNNIRNYKSWKHISRDLG